MVKVEAEIPAPRRKPSTTATPSTLDERTSPRLYWGTVRDGATWVMYRRHLERRCPVPLREHM